MNDYGRNHITLDANDDDRTRALDIQRKQRRPDSIAWIISALLLFFINVVALGRITVIGQLLDDLVFTFLFGWFKYFLYLLFFIIDFAIYFGIKFKPKKRFLAMIFVTWIMCCWVISSILFIVAHNLKSDDLVIPNYWSKDIFLNSLKSYLTQWKTHSFFGSTQNLLVSSKDSYFTTYAGGGFIGAFLSGISSYLTIYGSLILALVFFFINMVWIFTGDPFYLFKPKNKRRGKRLRILSLKSKDSNGNINKIKRPKRNSIFSVINLDGERTLDERDILASVKESDITIEMPSYIKNSDHYIYRNVDENFYNEDYVSSPQASYDPIFDFDQNILGSSSKGYLQVQDNYNNLAEQQNFQQYQNFNNQNNYNYQQSYQQTPKFMNQYQDMGYTNNQFTGNDNSLFANSQIEAKENFIEAQEDVRKAFERQTSITPHGFNGKTQEFLSAMKKEKLEKEGQVQSTLDQFLVKDKVYKNEVETNAFSEEYVSPMENIVKTNFHGDYGYSRQNNSSNTIELDTNKAIEKTVFVNLGYQLPSIELLNVDENSRHEYEKLKAQAQLKENSINNTFREFNVDAKVVDKNIGPTVTKFEVQPGPRTKVNNVTSLENDLKLSLATQNIRIEAPIPGKTLVGIEVPNDTSMVVPLRSVIEKAPLTKISSKLLFAIGKTVSGELLFGELDKAPHLLVAGSTGSGKSVMINGIITSILLRAKPHEVKLLLIDPKKVELSIYSSIPHLLAPVISDMNLANSALKKVINEMERRYALMQSTKTKNIETYNATVKDPAKKLPFYVVVIDELADLMMTANKKDVEDSIKRITQMARAAGIHLIVATQRPSTDVITGVIKSNITTRIGFSVASTIDSRTILDSSGAEKLIGKGDLLYHPPNANNVTRAQGSFVSDDEIKRIVDHCSRQQNQMFEEEFMVQENESYEPSGGSRQKDPLFEEIKQYVIREQKASTSLIQRKFSIGYGRAARIIDELEENGVIGPAKNNSKPRDVYIKNGDFY
ncbi:DNA translocase FtsK [Spiroplasma tabanidicola]|uniref:DNA translocase n=1 Tax=Spiroplasma tabanidicola TaxID=324079 RepID=A0A6I6CBT7_9MOLU|nr:DNA translocase FtsK [Spiroplasma tabanidicola]QGS51678.1 DNA translocase [Spiroplasma tabanidicola]